MAATWSAPAAGGWLSVPSEQAAGSPTARISDNGLSRFRMVQFINGGVVNVIALEAVTKSVMPWQ
jgi:hypothetical protein